jgi:cytochrome c553
VLRVKAHDVSRRLSDRAEWRATCYLLLGLVMLAPAKAYGDAKAGEKKAQLCLLCHKPNNREAWLPTLEGQTREYLVTQLKAFKEKRRFNPAMQTNAMSLSDRDIRDIADYFASRKPVRGAYTLDGLKVGRGKVLVEKSKCGECHGANHGGRKEIPRLAGMDPRYASSQLLAFAAGTRAHPAPEVFSSLSEGDAKSIGEYLAGLE